MRHAGIPCTALVALAIVLPSIVAAHVFPDHSEPRVGHTLDAPPTTVRIWFDGAVEPEFSTLRVVNSAGDRVDNGDGRVVATDPRLLEIGVRPSLPPGRYRVFWSVVARDGHRTEGDYTFRIK